MVFEPVHKTIGSQDVATRELCRGVRVKMISSAIFIEAHRAILVLGRWAKILRLDAWKIDHETENFVMLDGCRVKDTGEYVFDLVQGEHEPFTNHIMNDLIIDKIRGNRHFGKEKIGVSL